MDALVFYVPYHTILYEYVLSLVLKLCSSVDYYTIPNLHPPFARRPAKQTRSTITLSPFTFTLPTFAFFAFNFSASLLILLHHNSPSAHPFL